MISFPKLSSIFLSIQYVLNFPVILNVSLSIKSVKSQDFCIEVNHCHLYNRIGTMPMPQDTSSIAEFRIAKPAERLMLCYQGGVVAFSKTRRIGLHEHIGCCKG